MERRTDIREGMVVRSADGDRLGKIIRLDDQGLQIEKGIFFPKDYLANFDQIDTVQGDNVYLKWGTELVHQQYDTQFGPGSYAQETMDSEAWRDYRKSELDTSAQTESVAPVSEMMERDIQLKEEELSAQKKGMHEVGRVRIIKTIRTEDQHFTIPVNREEVRIERVPGGSMAAGDINLSEFKEETITVPIREEEIEVTKRPVVREELHVKTAVEQVDREVVGTVRKEEAHVEREEAKPPKRKVS